MRQLLFFIPSGAFLDLKKKVHYSSGIYVIFFFNKKFEKNKRRFYSLDNYP